MIWRDLDLEDGLSCSQIQTHTQDTVILLSVAVGFVPKNSNTGCSQQQYHSNHVMEDADYVSVCMYLLVMAVNNVEKVIQLNMNSRYCSDICHTSV